MRDRGQAGKHLCPILPSRVPPDRAVSLYQLRSPPRSEWKKTAIDEEVQSPTRTNDALLEVEFKQIQKKPEEVSALQQPFLSSKLSEECCAYATSL